MSSINILLHFVWSTKDRVHYLESSIRQKVFDHIKENAEKKGISIIAINGYSDHVHVLARLKRDQTAQKIANLLKGESSNWINKNNLISEKFYWEDGYWAESIGRLDFKRILEYIKKQEEHHEAKTINIRYELHEQAAEG